jgi:hypothetical protein
VRARLKGVHCDAIPDLAAWRPPVPDSFGVALVLEVGPLGLRGREEFHLLVVTPRWLEERHGAGGAVVGHGLLVVFAWRWEAIRAFLAREVERCSGPTWPAVARQVSRIAQWEGDDGGDVVGLHVPGS